MWCMQMCPPMMMMRHGQGGSQSASPIADQRRAEAKEHTFNQQLRHNRCSLPAVLFQSILSFLSPIHTSIYRLFFLLPFCFPLSRDVVLPFLVYFFCFFLFLLLACSKTLNYLFSAADVWCFSVAQVSYRYVNSNAALKVIIILVLLSCVLRRQVYVTVTV